MPGARHYAAIDNKKPRKFRTYFNKLLSSFKFHPDPPFEKLKVMQFSLFISFPGFYIHQKRRCYATTSKEEVY